MTRLPYTDPADASPPVAEALAKLPDLNLFRMLAQADSAFVPWLRYGGALLGRLALDPVRRELAILHVARLCGSEYELVQHREIALVVGASAAQVRAVEDGETAGLGEDLEAILEFTGEAVRDLAASPAALDAVRAFLSPREVVELLLVIGHYVAIARVVATLGIEPDDPAQLEVISRKD